MRNENMLFTRAPWRLAAALLLTLALVRPAPAGPPEGRWNEDYKAGMAVAKTDNRPALLMFSASWCGPCNRMKKEVFTQAVVKRMLDNWVAIYIDGDKNHELMEQFHAEAFPTFIVLDPKGNEMGRFVGGVAADEFLNNLRIIRTELPAVQRQLAADPRNPALWKKRGRLLEDMGNIDEAVKAYQRAASFDPENKTGVAIDVAFFNAAKMTDEGPKALDKRFYDFLNRYPNSPRAEDAIFNRARIAFDDKRFKDCTVLIDIYDAKYPKGKYKNEVAGIRRFLQSEQPTRSKTLKPQG